MLMASNGIQVSCRIRQECNVDTGSWPPGVIVDSSAHRVVVTHPSTSTSNGTNLVDSRSSVDADLACGGTTYSCFDGVYPDHATQQEVFESIGRPFVTDLLAGYNCTIIAYGQTGSGKTYTTVGGDTTEARGIVPRAMEAILDKISRIDLAEFNVSLTASFVEVYQERLRDLLFQNSARPLRLREDKDHDVRVEGASEIAISTVASGMAVLSRGNAQRSTGSTLMNVDSSRSHSVLILTFTKKHIARGTKVKSKMCIVDLAGSEKVRKSAATGVRMEEAKHINRSLSALGNVINALTDENVKHVPYRDSKLTRLLQTSLGGNAKTHLLLTCSASSLHNEETLSTLRFGSRAKNIKNSPHINNESVGTATEYSELLTMLQDKIENLHSYIRQLETSQCALCKSRGPVFGIDSQQPLEDATTPRCSTCPGEDTEPDPQDDSDFITDDLMRAEMQTLRKALTNMLRDHENQEHAHHVTKTMMEMTEQQLDSRHRSQEQTIQRQEVELNDALATISRLENKLEVLEESSGAMSAELHRFRVQQQKQQAGENAEAEILRRQLEMSDKQVKQLQAKMVASEGLTTDLKSRLVTKEHELSSLCREMNALRLRKLPVTMPSVISVGLPSPNRVPQTRPVTAVELKSFVVSRGDVKNCNGGLSNIQSWWAGPVAETPSRNQDETAALQEQRVLDHVLPIAGPPKSTGATQSDDGSRGVTCGRENTLPPAENAASRVCTSASSTTRPFRARLVGLLNSLEDETSAYRNLVVETKDRATTSIGARPRRQLPCLDELVTQLPPSAP